MKIKTTFIKSFLLFSLAISWVHAPAQDRPVIWVHGLGENGTTWNIYDNLFDAERQIDGRSRAYNDGSGVATFATGVNDGITNDFPGTSGPGTTNIGIGHSLGGLAIRELDRTRTGNNRRLGGLITIGTPNDGAPIVNSIQNGNVTNAMNNACERLSAGPFSEIPYVPVIVKAVSNNIICNILSNNLLDGIFQAQAAGPSPADAALGSPFLTTLNSAGPNIPAISIRGNENSPVHWRLLSSFDTDNEDDTKYVEIANLMRNIYNGFYIYHLSGAVVGGVFGFINPVAWVVAAIHAWKATQWHKGKKWFDQSESIWNGLIGCTGGFQDVTVTYTTQVVNCNCFGYTGSQPWIDCVMNLCGGSLNGCWQTVTYTTSIAVNNSSDGLFCDQTQLINGLPGGNYFEAKGVNHMEETNTTNGTTNNGNDEVGDKFRAIWNRTDVFKILPR
ncbi:MAG: alpha/beta hydrolase [Saprospiraceae bacterium]|nr:MAG: alpha/beta hydrolase [Saprospiraceae bacterium]